MRIATEHEMRGINVWCPVLKKLVTINVYSLIPWQNHSDAVDNKGVDVDFRCECGDEHTIEN